MRYVSTETHLTASFQQAVTQCYAPDSGLYLPEPLPVIPRAYFNNIEEMSLREIAYVVATAFLSGVTPPRVLKQVVDDTFDFPIPLVGLDGGDDAPVRILELFGGPTLAFKDISARFMARYLRTVPRPQRRDIALVVATTGNTGAAIAHAFDGTEGVQVIVLYPRGAMSAAEVAQFAGAAPNVHALEVAGDIDMCKRMVRGAVTDTDLTERIPVVSGNTNNIIRLLPQIVYFFHAYARLRAKERNPDGFTLAIPCGNLSNLTSAVMAKRMGLPAGLIIAGCNANESTARLLGGDFSDAVAHVPARRTLARAMDLGYPTNFPRLKALYGGNPEALRAEIKAATVSDDEIARTIRETADATGYLMDPHTAVAYAALRRTGPLDRPAVVLATAHPAKSPGQMEAITGLRPELPASRRRCESVPGARPVKIAPTVPALKKFILSL